MGNSSDGFKNDIILLLYVRFYKSYSEKFR